MNLAFFASGSGSNMQSIIDAHKDGVLKSVPSVLISNNSKCGAIERAKKEAIAWYHISGKTHPDEGVMEAAMLEALNYHNVDLIILAGYMKKMSPGILKAYHNRVLNIHPGLLPKFGGHGMYGHFVHEAVLQAKDVISGPTVHLVNAEYDKGPVLAQIQVPVLPGDDAESLSARVLKQEHIIYPDTIRRIESGEISLDI
jgi:phosphoribosylglycinamide formyltransferase-1